MAKRVTKAEREARQRAALRLRVSDIVAGAHGCRLHPQDDVIASGQCMADTVATLQETFGVEGKDWWWQGRSLRHFETVDSITSFLFEMGVRA